MALNSSHKAQIEKSNKTYFLSHLMKSNSNPERSRCDPLSPGNIQIQATIIMSFHFLGSLLHEKVKIPCKNEKEKFMFRTFFFQENGNERDF